MPLSRPAALLVSVLLLTPGLAAQQPPRRDPQAVSVLVQCLNAGGGVGAISAVQDFIAAGTITYYWAWKEVSGTVTVRGRVYDQFRLDATIPQGTRSLAVSRGVGFLREVNGTIFPFHSLNAVNVKTLSFPFSEILEALNGPTIDISYSGLVEVLGRQVHRIRAQRRPTSGADLGGILTRLKTKDYFVDPATLLVVKTEHIFYPKKALSEGLPYEVYFSDYRLVNGVLTPFSITEKVGGQRTWTIQLSSIRFNAGLTDGDFRF